MERRISNSICILFFAIVFTLIPAVLANAQKIDEAKIRKAIEDLSVDYKDVPSSLICKPPASQAEKIICSDRLLRLMERLDTMASIYMVENGTHRPIAHDKRSVMRESSIKAIRKLKTVDDIRKVYIDSTNNSLGGESPYYVDSP